MQAQKLIDNPGSMDNAKTVETIKKYNTEQVDKMDFGSVTPDIKNQVTSILKG